MTRNDTRKPMAPSSINRLNAKHRAEVKRGTGYDQAVINVANAAGLTLVRDGCTKYTNLYRTENGRYVTGWMVGSTDSGFDNQID